ncbi:hypothetical protein BX600DRAFT_434893 [Xylariales sp. PMI_506]|nr:hypothetical protein BX600DRAFT_434893 [Xylariales sp. PMI_506]
MPVTVFPSAHASKSFSGSNYKRTLSPEVLLTCTLTDDSRKHENAKRLLQSSFGNLRAEDVVFATKNGLVHTCIEAYNQHHCLVIRPDDIWLGILVQFNSYVNAHSEELRSLFIEHAGQLGLHIEANLDDIDHGKMAFLMAKLMQQKVKDEELQQWVLPAFTTTTKIDQAVASIIFMGTMQKYFTYSWGTRCGLPLVTLMGEVNDWIKIKQRAEKLATFGPEPCRWLCLLRPILSGFVSTFYEPESPAVKEFWQGICDEHQPNGSGSITYSGWITAFCFWDEKGKCLHDVPSQEVRLTRGLMPASFVQVPVTLYNDGVAINTQITAGSMAIKASRSSQRAAEDNQTETKSYRSSRGLDQIQPEIGWFIHKT